MLASLSSSAGCTAPLCTFMIDGLTGGFAHVPASIQHSLLLAAVLQLSASHIGAALTHTTHTYRDGCVKGQGIVAHSCAHIGTRVRSMQRVPFCRFWHVQPPITTMDAGPAKHVAHSQKQDTEDSPTVSLWIVAQAMSDKHICSSRHAKLQP